MSFLLDTDTCSAHLKNNPRVGNRIVQYGGRLHVSTITVGELYVWALRAKAPMKRTIDIRGFLKDVTILKFDESEARKFGELRAGLLDRGLPAPDLDLLNAATAIVHNLTLVTHNTRDYVNVPGLSLADWLVP